MSLDIAKLVEQARELSFALATIDRRYDDAELLAGLADAVEQLQADHGDCVPVDKVVIHSDLDGRLHVSTLVRERNAARAEVVRLTDGIREHRDEWPSSIGDPTPHDDRLHALLDVAGDDALDEIVRVSEDAGLYDMEDGQ